MKFYKPQDLTGYEFYTNFYFWYDHKIPDCALLWIDFNSIFKIEVEPPIFRKFVE